MTTPATDKKSISLKFIFLLFAYFSLHIFLRVMLSDSLDYDEAEQALLGQWLLPGYTEQPPLYTWMQFYLFQLFGKGVFGVSLLKNALLFLTYLFVFLSGEKLFKNTRTSILATSSLILIPQIAWESQRDMTHTTLVVFAAASVLWVSLRLIEQKSLLNYCLFGLLCGIGVLAKANFAIFLTVLSLTLLTCREGRKVIFSKMIFVTLMITAVMSGYYVLWMFNNHDIVFSAAHKFKRVTENYYLSGIRSFLTNTFQFLTPLWFFYLLIFPKGYLGSLTRRDRFSSQFMFRYGLFFLFTLVAIIVAFKVSYVKDRWLQPLLFAAPIIFFSSFKETAITDKKFRQFLLVAAIAAIGVYTAFTIRVVGGPLTGYYSRLNYPFTVLAKEIRKAGFSQGLIISDNRFLAGNMLFHFQGSNALIPGYHFEQLPSVRRHSSAAIIWKADTSAKIPDRLAAFITDTYNLDPTAYPVSYFEKPYKYSQDETIKLALLLLPLPEKTL